MKKRKAEQGESRWLKKKKVNKILKLIISVLGTF